MINKGEEVLGKGLKDHQSGAGCRPRTNDSLAHVWRYRELGSLSAFENQLSQELATDLLERSGRGFRATTEFELADDDLVSDTGLSLRQVLARGVEAAQADIELLGTDYGYKRELARQKELDWLLDWQKEGCPGVLMINSLCPAIDELPRATANRLNFRQDEQMSSNTVYQLTTGGQIRATHFSLSGHDLAKQHQLQASLGLGPSLPTTLETLSKAWRVDSLESLQKALNDIFGHQEVAELDQKRFERAKQDHETMIKTVSRSLRRCRVSRRLGRLASSQNLYLEPNSNFGLEEAREYLEMVRSQVMPQYIWSQANGSNQGQRLEYPGLCPTGYRPKSWHYIFSNRLSVGYGRCRTCRSPKPLYGCGIFCWLCNYRWSQAH